MSKPARKLLFVVSEDWYFLSHRLELAVAARAAGWDVIVATQVNREEDAARITSAGLRLYPLALDRGRLIAPGDVGYFCRLVALYQREQPDVIHHVAMKPILFGSLAALLVPRAGVVNALAGLGYLFTSGRGRVRAVRAVVLKAFGLLFRRARSRLILQNLEDLRLFRDRIGIPEGRLRLIRGMGVDLSRYHPVKHAKRDRPVIVMVSRMLRDKGVLELVEAARCLHRDGVGARIRLVGGVDEKNPNSLSLADMEAISREGLVEWHGASRDVAAIYGQADIAVLPSYREGLPKSLLEAAAAGLPIVATDTSGCREVVTEGENGRLVPVRDARRLADALRELILDPALRARMGFRSRQRAEGEFQQAMVIAQTLAVYREVEGA